VHKNGIFVKKIVIHKHVQRRKNLLTRTILKFSFRKNDFLVIVKILSGTPRENRAKKKVDFRFFYFFFFIYMKDQVKKSLSLVGNKIKSFILIDIGETRKKRFLDLF